MTHAALIVAAGRGQRMESATPKQYLPLAGKTVLWHTIDAFLRVPEIGIVQVVIHPEDADLYSGAIEGLKDTRLAAPCFGGATRAASVRNGLQSLEEFAPQTVLIHDAARPLFSERLVEDLLAALETSDGAFAALPVVDALWRSQGGFASTPVDRTDMWRAQTPQAFQFAKILHAHATLSADAADDVEVAVNAGLSVKIVPGEEMNFKITLPQDLVRAERLIAERAR